MGWGGRGASFDTSLAIPVVGLAPVEVDVMYLGAAVARCDNCVVACTAAWSRTARLDMD